MTWGTLDFEGIAMVTYGHNLPEETMTFLLAPWLSALGLDEDFVNAASEALGTVDPVERTAKYKELGKDVVNDCSTFGICSPYELTCYWPWLKNYYGEVETGQHNMNPMFANLWIDQALKAEMGIR